MAIADFTTFKSRLETTERQFIRTVEDTRQNATNTAHGNWTTGWYCIRTGPGTTNNIGVVPTTATVPTRTTAGSMLKNLQLSGSTALNLISINATTREMTVCCMLVDRLSHQGGLAGNTTSTQTTNLPTAALDRYTDGVGVMIALELYSNFSDSNAANVTVSYTNQSGTSGRSATARIGGGNHLGTATAGMTVFCALQAGDTGARSVESVTLASALGAAGNFGVTLYKPLNIICCNPGNALNSINMVTGGVVGPSTIPADTCLTMLFTCCFLPGTTFGANVLPVRDLRPTFEFQWSQE